VLHLVLIVKLLYSTDFQKHSLADMFKFLSHAIQQVILNILAWGAESEQVLIVFIIIKFKIRRVTTILMNNPSSILLGASNIAVHLYLRNNLCTVEQILMKFSIWKFYQNFPALFKFG
jgi:hypothetical protein